MAEETMEGLATALSQTEKIVIIHSDPDNETLGTPVSIKKLRAKQFVKIFACIDDLVQKGVVRVTDETGNFVLGARGVLSEFRDEKMLLRGGEPVLEMLAIASGLKKETIDNLDLLDLGKLLGAAWEINERFFVQHQTELKQALGPVWKLVEGLTKKKQSPVASSPDSSIDSSAPATEPSSK